MIVLLICGGPSEEHEVSIDSASEIIKNIDRDSYDIDVMLIEKDMNSILMRSPDGPIISDRTLPKKDFYKNLDSISKYDLVFIGLHGTFGEDGVLQGILESKEIPFIGSDSYSSKLAMDKYRSSMLVEKSGLALIPESRLLYPGEVSKHKFSFPIVVKPNNSGSSVGVVFVEDKEGLERFLRINADGPVYSGHGLLVQEVINGIEISCGCLQRKDGTCFKLPPIEIRPKLGKFFDYDSKYKKGGSEEITPPIGISKELSDTISCIAIEIHQLLGCRGYSRSDFIVDKYDNVFYLETNTLPGMTSTSLLPQEASAAGKSYSELLTYLIENAL